MLPRTKLIILDVVFLVVGCNAIKEKAGCGGEPLYAKHGITPGPLNSPEAQIKSPDGKKMLTIKVGEGEKYPTGLYVSYGWQAGDKHLSARLDGFRAEVLWSPDSNAFAVNQTEGGGGIGQRAYIFYPGRNHLRKIDVSAPVERAFGSPVKCEVPVPPNTAVLKWLDSNRVLVVGEIVHVSLCKCGGTYRTYEVSLPSQKILRVYSQAETKRRFGDSLGCELRGADDACAITWQ